MTPSQLNPTRSHCPHWQGLSILSALSNTDTDACVVWPYYRMKNSRNGKIDYGTLTFQGKKTTVHRVAWLLNGKIVQPKEDVCHSCDNPGCVNLRHLFAATHKKNMQDCQQKGRNTKLLGSANPSAKLTENQIKEIRALYKKNTLSCSPRALAKKFGVAPSCAWNIVKGKTWKHLL